MIGKEILNYKIVSLIGEGGMGSVYLAEHKYITEQKAAIKVIHPEMVNNFTREELKKEATNLASLKHPNIVHFLDYHIEDDGSIYLIMEYADGVTLDKYIQSISGLIVEDRICPLFEPILDAVGYAHSHGIIHRDIKPNNIMITKDGTPKILDFGIAKIVKNEEEDQEDNMVMGTPSYMSPEQVKGQKLSPCSDIYSLGVLLHQMLTGNAPYDTTTLTEFDISKKVVEEPLPRMRTYYKYVSDRIQKVVDKATDKDSKKRYQSCSEFKKALHNAVYPPKIPMWAKVSAAVAFLIIVIGGGILWDYNRTKIYFYKDYVEQWGIPQGIHELTATEQAHRVNAYKFVYRNWKLQEISYINSKGHLITHTSTDDIDLPTRMTMHYRSNGKLDKVKVYDQSGKNLYVKDYNEEMNVAVFKYDDQYETEKMLAASTTESFSSSTTESNTHSRINRYLLTYDENGYVIKVEYASYQNEKVGDADGIYGRAYKVDEKGRNIEETYLGFDGEPKAINTGLAIRTRRYSAGDDCEYYQYLTVDREPAGEKGLGIPACHNFFDEWGNEIRQVAEDLDGNLALRQDMKACGFEYTIIKGQIVKQYYVGLDGSYSYISNGSLGMECGYDENGYLNYLKNIDADGNPISVEGVCINKMENDEFGNILTYTNFDENGNPISYKTGHHKMVRQYDDRGNEIKTSFFDIEGNLVINDSWEAASIESKYDEYNRLIYQRFLDTNNEPMIGGGIDVCVVTSEYSRQGNLISRKFYDTTGENLMLSNEEIAGWISTYDEKGNETSRQFIGEDGQPKNLGGEKYVLIEYTYDEKSQLIEERYLDKIGNLTISSNGYAGVRYKRDERGNVIEDFSFGVDKKLAPGRLIIRYSYDSHDNLTELAVFDANEKPALNTYDYHKSTTVFNNRNQEVETRYFGKNGEPVLYNGDYAIVRYEYDDKGNTTSVATFDTNDKPFASKNRKYATQKSEFDQYNRIIHQSFYDENGNPTTPSVMVPEGFVQYDNKDNMIYLASGDGHGNLIYNSNTGAVITRYKYDDRSRVIEESYFDENDQPMVNKLTNYHKEFKTYGKTDDGGTVETEAYFDAAGNPIKVGNGVHKIIMKKDAVGNVVEKTFWDTQERAINAPYHKEIYTFDETGTCTRQAAYYANGTLYVAFRWNGKDWVNEAQPSSAPATNSSSSTASSSTQSLDDLILESQTELPLDINDDLKWTELKKKDATHCEMIVRAKKSKYDSTEEEMNIWSITVGAMGEYVKSQLSGNITVKVTLYDSKSRVLFTKDY